MDMTIFVASLTTAEIADLRRAIDMREQCRLGHLTAEEKQLDKIPAIKSVRLRLGIGLKEAKDFYEREWRSGHETRGTVARL